MGPAKVQLLGYSFVSEFGLSYTVLPLSSASVERRRDGRTSSLSPTGGALPQVALVAAPLLPGSAVALARVPGPAANHPTAVSESSRATSDVLACA
jgi:hypothetical protein